MWVRITGFRDDQLVTLFRVTVEKGRPVVLACQRGQDSDGFAADLVANGVVGLNGKRYFPTDPTFLDKLQEQYRSIYFCAHAPEA